MSRPRIDEAEVRTVLNTIIDPCSRAAGARAGLVDMGLVRSLRIFPRGELVDVRVTIGVTEFGCFIGPSFAMEAYKRLTSLEGVGEVQVELDKNFDWTPEDMSLPYRALLDERRAEGNAKLLPLLMASRDGAAKR